MPRLTAASSRATSARDRPSRAASASSMSSDRVARPLPSVWRTSIAPGVARSSVHHFLRDVDQRLRVLREHADLDRRIDRRALAEAAGHHVRIRQGLGGALAHPVHQRRQVAVAAVIATMRPRCGERGILIRL
jgi:hypothetical protein